MTRLLRGLVSLGALLAAGLALSRPAEAATKISTGSGWWATSTIWSPTGVPSTTDDVIIAAGHVVEIGNTTVRVTYVVNSLETRPGGRLQRYNPGTTGTFQCGLRCAGVGPTGYSILNRGQIHNQVNSTTFIEANGPVHTDGSSIASRTSQAMGGFSWGWNNVNHGGQAWNHGHLGSNGDATPGICLILKGGTVTSPLAVTQAAAINIDSAPFAASLDALPRTYVRGFFRLGSNLEFFSFENRIEAAGSLDLNGYRLLAQGPVHVGDPSTNSTTYSMTTFTRGMTALTSPTNIWDGSVTIVDDSTQSVSIGFSFTYYGTNYTTCYVCSNGFLNFGTASASFSNTNVPTAGAPDAAVFGCWDDLYIRNQGTADRVNYATTGTSPNRVFTAEWLNVSHIISGTDDITFQVKLYETTNVAEIHYSTSNTWSNVTSSIGIEDQSGANGFDATGGSPNQATVPTTNFRFTPGTTTVQNCTLRIGDGTGTANVGTWPQFRITGGPASEWSYGALVEIPTGSHGSGSLGTAVLMYGSSRLNIYSEPTIPVALQNGLAPTFWIIGNLMVGGTGRVDIVVPSSPTNASNSLLQVGQDLSFENTMVVPKSGSAGWITQTGNHGPTGFPIVLVQSGAGGGNNFLPPSDWQGMAGGTTVGTTTAGWTATNSTVIHQGGANVFDDFRFVASGGNPGSAWGLHSVQIGLGQYQWGASTILITNGTNLAMGGLGTRFTLDGSALTVNGNRAALNGGGGNLFASSGAVFTQQKRPTNMPADGSIGVVDVNGNLQVTGSAAYNLGLAAAGENSTLRVLGQGTIPPSNISGVPQLVRQAPLGNLSIDDGGALTSPNASNILVFIGEKWHSSGVTLKIHPSKVTALLNGRTASFTASGGASPFSFALVSGGGTLTGATYTAPATGTGTAVIRVTDSATPSQFVDAVVTYQGLSTGPLSLSPGYENAATPGYCYYLRGDLGSTMALRAFGGTGSYSWSLSPTTGAGSLSGTSGQTVTYTAGGGGTTASPVFTIATATLSDGGTTGTRTCYFYVYNSTTYGSYYPIPYYAYHWRVNDTQTYSRPGLSGTWAFTSRPSGCTVNGGTTATGTAVTMMVGTTGGLTAYDFAHYNYGTVTSATATGYFYFYTTARPSNLTISPTRLDGWLPGATYQFGSGGGTSPYTFSLTVNGGGSSVTTGGLYTAGATSVSADTVQLRDTTGVTVTSQIFKSVGTPPNGNAYVATPGARTIFTNSSANSVDQLVFADANDDFGSLQVLKTLATGPRVVAGTMEITPILLTMMSATSQTFTATGGTAPYTFSLAVNNSGASIGASTGVYTAGTTVNRVDTVRVQDSAGRFARATVNVVSTAGAQALEIRPRYIYYFYPGQAFQFRATGGVGGVTWTLQQNNSGAAISGTGVYTAGPAGNALQDTIRVADAAGNYDIAWVYVWNWSPYVYPLWAYFDWDTGAGKSRNGFDPGQTLRITTVGLGTNPNWTYSTNASGGTLTSSGTTATWTVGSTGNVTDMITAAQGGTSYTGYYKVLPPPISVSPSLASAFGGTILRFSASGGTGSYTYSILSNSSGASLVQSGTPAVGMYTAGVTAGTDTIRVSDGTSWADVQVSVLAQANPTSLFCSHTDLWHGELDLSGRMARVRRQGATPVGQGDLISTNGGIGGATNPALRMGTGAQLTVDRTFVW
ncbi:MAG: hypothetical protein L0216_02390, partial [Planctomycetales bacterium]|nr:hypothetical protein [Planctomycetales bacterium]